MGTHIWLRPNARFGHGGNQVRAGEEEDLDVTHFTLQSGNAPHFVVDFMLEMVEDDSGALVRLESLPRVDHQPRGRLLGG